MFDFLGKMLEVGASAFGVSKLIESWAEITNPTTLRLRIRSDLRTYDHTPESVRQLYRTLERFINIATSSGDYAARDQYNTIKELVIEEANRLGIISER